MTQTIIQAPECKRLKQLQADTGRGEMMCAIALLMEDNRYDEAKHYVDCLNGNYIENDPYKFVW